MSNLALETLLAGAYGGQGGSGGSGGGSGTTNYNDLSNRPKINGVTLSGDKSASDLGIAEYDDTALDARVTAVETALTGKADTSDIPDVSGKANTSDLATVATSGSYNDLSNKPTIPSAYDDSALTERVSDLETDVNDLKTNGASVTVDSTLSDTSENPVQNKVIKAALDGLSVSGVVVDTALSDTSENPVQNKVIKAALDDKADSADIPDISGKANTADLAAVATSGAYSDLTGTPTIPEAAEIATAAKAGLVKPGSGLNITSDGTLVVTTPVDGNTKTAATYTVEYDANTHSLVRRKLADDGNGYDADFTPQTIELPDWSGEIATAKAEVESEVGAVANAGAKNLCSNSYEKAVKSYNGMTFTRNDDGSVTANGTASADAYYHLMPTGSKLAAGKYILSGCPSGGATSKYRIAIAREASGDKARIDYNDFGSSVELTAESDDTFISYIFVRSGNTLNNLVFYPLLRDASITDDTYVPYGMSNAELTEEIKGRALNGSSEYVQFSQDAAISKANVSGKGIQDGIDLVGRDTDGKQWLARLHHAEKQITLMHTDGSTWTTDATFTADEDTGWQTPDPTNLPNFKYRRKNGHVTVTGYGGVGGVAAKTTKTLFTLPEGFRPSIRVDSAAHLANGSNEPVCQFLATTDGKVNVWANTEIASGVSVCGSICFPV